MSAIFSHIEEGRFEEFRKLIDKSKSLAHEKDQSGQTPLHYACQENQLEMVKVYDFVYGSF